MPDLGKLYQKPAGVAVKPKLLPAAEGYVGILTGHQVSGKPEGREVNYEESVRFGIRPLEWPDSVDAEDRLETLTEGGKPTTINLASKSLSFSFYDNRLDILDKFLRDDLGIDLAGKGYAEALNEATGSRVRFDVKWRQDNRTPGEFVAFADNLRGEGD